MMNSRLNQSDRPGEIPLADAMRGSAEQIWQAGLGVFAKAQQEGEEVFAKMVEQGVDVQRRAQELAGERLSGLTDAMTRVAENLNTQASGSWERLENAIEERISRSLHNLGVPTRDDIEALGAQIGELQKSVNTLTEKKSTKKAAPKKSAAKTAKKQNGAKAPKSATATTSARHPSRRASASAAGRS